MHKFSCLLWELKFWVIRNSKCFSYAKSIAGPLTWKKSSVLSLYMYFISSLQVSWKPTANYRFSFVFLYIKTILLQLYWRICSHLSTKKNGVSTLVNSFSILSMILGRKHWALSLTCQNKFTWKNLSVNLNASKTFDNVYCKTGNNYSLRLKRRHRSSVALLLKIFPLSIY